MKLHKENQPQTAEEDWLVWERHESGVYNYRGDEDE